MEQVKTPTFEKWDDIKWIRTWFEMYQDSGWIIGTYGDSYVVWLDRKNDEPVLVNFNDIDI